MKRLAPLCVLALLAGGFAPAQDPKDKADFKEKANQAVSVNNLKQIIIALHNYHDTYKKLPAQAISDKAGKPLLSWRVAILPYIEELELFKQFKMDEPWDSNHNKKLIDKMPKLYRSPGSKAKPGLTTYLGLDGEGTIFAKVMGKPPLTLARISAMDGVSNTVIVVEADDERAVPWTKPEDLRVDRNDPHRGLGNNPRKSFNAAFADGVVRTIPRAIKGEMLYRLFRYDDGQPVELPK